MSGEVAAAYVAAGASLVTLVGTLYSQHRDRRAISQDNEKTLKQQEKQLATTLAAQQNELERTLGEQRQHLDRTLGEQRTRALNERFATAAGQLGGDQPPAVQLAGVYAMAGLADDWKESRQTCVDVLCGYLRMPFAPNPGESSQQDEQLAFSAGQQVRHTLIRVIAAHLQGDAEVSWQRLNLDFTGAVLDGGEFDGAQFSGGLISFDNAVFSNGLVSFRNASFSGASVFLLAQPTSLMLTFAGVSLILAALTSPAVAYFGWCKIF